MRKIGSIGEIIDVKRGFARNFLISKKKALFASKENIKEVEGLLQRLCPDAKIKTGHGQMDGKNLEKLMIDFMEGNFDILVSTTIIENGVDIPNTNTMEPKMPIQSKLIRTSCQNKINLADKRWFLICIIESKQNK